MAGVDTGPPRPYRTEKGDVIGSPTDVERTVRSGSGVMDSLVREVLTFWFGDAVPAGHRR